LNLIASAAKNARRFGARFQTRLLHLQKTRAGTARVFIHDCFSRKKRTPTKTTNA
jgi:hypothetical protein